MEINTRCSVAQENSVLAELQLSVDMRHEMESILKDVKSDLASISAWKRQGFELSFEEYLLRSKNDNYYRSKEAKAARKMEEEEKKKAKKKADKADAAAAKAAVARAIREPINPFDKPGSSTSPKKVPLNLKSRISSLASLCGAEHSNNRSSIPMSIPVSPTRVQISSVAAKSRGI